MTRQLPLHEAKDASDDYKDDDDDDDNDDERINFNVA